ncbi:MAG: DUF2149 domain-containing protein [Deltaproteobacteria bacterium]|jgi:hypothetical protein|nr:DUF2149 domain-containing protein [Deltaproteobacteria bacterium]
MKTPKRFSLEGQGGKTPEADDPMSSMINLVDIFLVFIVAVLISFLSAIGLQDLLAKDSRVTVLTQSADGEMTIIDKQGSKLEATKVTRSEAEGRGVRLGVAYQLEDGSMVYMPDDDQP